MECLRWFQDLTMYVRYQMYRRVHKEEMQDKDRGLWNQ